MSAQPNACPVCGETRKMSSIRFRCQPLVDGFVDPCENATQLAIERAKRIAHLEAALTRIKNLTDAPYAAPGVPGGQLVDAALEWAVNEAETALKDTP